jgi:hypothetical protein
MTDISMTLDEAFDSASSTLTSESGSQGATQEKPNENKEPVIDSAKTEDNPVEEPKVEVEETFAEKGDLTGKTPEQLEEIHKNWQRAYTAKRQAERKELEELRAKVSEIKPIEAVPDKPMSELTPEEYAMKVAEMAKTEVQTAGDNAYIESQEKAFYSLDTRLNQDSPEFDQDLQDLVMMRLSNAREAHDAQGLPIRDFDFLGKAKEYIGAFDSRLKNSNQSFLKKQTEIARTRSDNFAKEVPNTSNAKTKVKSMDLDDAIESAFGK